MKRFGFAGILAAMMTLGAASSASAQLLITEVGHFTFSDSSISELGGLTYVKDHPSGQLYYAVSDDTPVLIPLTIDVNLTTGAIQSVDVGTLLQLRTSGGSALPSNIDLEGVAYHANSGTVWISNESEPGLRRHNLTTGNTTSHITSTSHSQLNIYSSSPSNLRWESMTIQGDGEAMWTANEGPISFDLSGHVRLQKFDESQTPDGQYAYQLSSAPPSASHNGVSDLLALPDGTVIVMERVRDSGTVRIQLQQIDLTGATNLAGGNMSGATPVTKTELWSKTFDSSLDNFEGIALGPQLANGDYSVLLIADSGSATPHSMYALRLTIPEPASLSLLAVGGLLVMRRRRR